MSKLAEMTERHDLKIDELESVVGGIGIEAEAATPAQQRAHYDHQGGPFRFFNNKET